MATNMEDSKPPSGVYKNPRLMHACTTIVGSIVHLQTENGEVWEGILNTFSPEFTVCLNLCIQVDPKSHSSKDLLYAALKSESPAKDKVFFDLKNIVRITAIDVDLNYATRDMAKLTTDADISGYDANKSGEHRQLECWQDDDGDTANQDPLLSLDEVAASAGGNKRDSQNNSRGWDAQEMFNYNERVHKVTTTYDEKLTGYTLQLKPKDNTKDWRKRQERASAIANEIEGNSKSQIRIAKENEADCEEERFSAVVRPTQTNRPVSSSNKNQNNDGTNIASATNVSGLAPDDTTKQPMGSGGNLAQQDTHRQQPVHQQQHQQQQNQQSQPPQQQQQHPHQVQQPSQHQHHPHQHHQSPHASQQYNQPMHRTMPNRLNPSDQNGARYRPRFNDKRMDSLKNFGRRLQIGQQPRQSPNQMQNTSNNQNQSSHHQPQPPPPQQQQQPQQKQSPSQQQSPQQSQQSQQKQQIPLQQSQHQQSTPAQQQGPDHQQKPQQLQQHLQPAQPQPTQAPSTATTASPTTTTATSVVNTSTTSERSETSSLGSQVKDHQSELVKKSKLNPNAKEFVYKPRSPAANQSGAQSNGANQGPTSGVVATIDPSNPSQMSQVPPASYYQQVPMFAHGLSPHQQPHHATQFMPNHTHPHFQSQIHYMSPVPPHFAQHMPPRYIRGNFQNYHHRGEHHNNVRADYSQASMMVPTSSGQPYVPQPSGASHPMNAYATTPQQAMIYGGPPQSMYPVVQAGFPQHMPHVMPNPPPYDGSTVYMPSPNYIVNP